MESSQSGLLERLRAQRESMQAAAAAQAAAEQALPTIEDAVPGVEPPGAPSVGFAPLAESAASRDQAARIVKVESEGEVLRQRLDAVELSLRQELAELRRDVSDVVAADVARHTASTSEVLSDAVGRVGRLEAELTQERDRWSNVVTNFDLRLDHRLRSFRQDVTVMLAGMAVLVLAMLLLLLMRR
jgi:hypothetical protein